MAPNALTTSMSPKFALFRDLGVGGRGAPKSWTLSAPHSAPPILGVPAFSQHSRKKEKDLDRGHRKRGEISAITYAGHAHAGLSSGHFGGGQKFWEQGGPRDSVSASQSPPFWGHAAHRLLTTSGGSHSGDWKASRAGGTVNQQKVPSFLLGSSSAEGLLGPLLELASQADRALPGPQQMGEKGSKRQSQE